MKSTVICWINYVITPVTPSFSAPPDQPIYGGGDLFLLLSTTKVTV